MNNIKGIVLAGGAGSRLYPLTSATSKQILPIYDKPMIYYPLSVLMIAEIRDILIISSPDDIINFKRLFNDGSDFGLNIEYAIQAKPEGIPQAISIAESFIGNSNICLILGDNIFHGQGLYENINHAISRKNGATIFAYKVMDPKRFGIVEFNKNNEVISIEEKPLKPKSNYAVTGLYFYDNYAIELVKKLKPSARGELEISDLNKSYLKKNMLNVQIFGRGFAWLDTGTHESLIEASQYIQTIEKRQGFKVACLEEIAWRNGWLTTEDLVKKGRTIEKTPYGKYLLDITHDV